VAKKMFKVTNEPTYSKVDKVYVINQSGGGDGNITEHTHDDIYYRKNEIDSSINSLANSLHTVKAHANDEPSYLASKVDNVTLAVEDSELKVKNVDGLTVGVSDISNWLNGTSGNLQDQINDINASLVAITSGMRYIGKFETYADMQAIVNKEGGDLVVVLADEARGGGRSMYVYSDALGMWDFIGEFTFTDEFIKLSDTPASYVGTDGKVLKADETNGKLVFSRINYSELADKPTSTITQIDDAVAKSHEHVNKSLLDTYSHTNAEIASAINQAHTHANKSSLDKLGVNADGELMINGVVYAPVTTQPKQSLYARRTGTGQELTAGTDCVFNTKYRGEGIPYNVGTGVFTLQAGKTYRVFVTASIQTEGYVILRAVTASNNTPTPDNNQAIWMSVTPSNTNWKEASAGPLVAYITPTETQGYKIRATSVSGVTTLRTGHCALDITEV